MVVKYLLRENSLTNINFRHRKVGITTFFFPLMIMFLLHAVSYQHTLADSSYMPIHSGYRWDYKSSINSYTSNTIDTVKINGIAYCRFDNFMHNSSLLRAKGGKVYFFNNHDSAEFVLYDFTINVDDTIKIPPGYECSFGRKSYLVSKTDTVVTPMGTFYNCFHLQHQLLCMDAGITDECFAKGVGLVQYITENFYGLNTYLLESFSVLTSINAKSAREAEHTFELFQNYPNPFNPTTTIKYSIPAVETLHATSVQLIIYDILGREVATLVNEQKSPGNYEVTFDASHVEHGRSIASGVYIYQLRAGNPSAGLGHGFVQTKKLLLMK